MAIGLDPITLAEASPIMAEAMDLSWPEDKSKIIGYVNKYRNLLYTLYNDFKLFDNIFHCICVSQFDGYRGITYRTTCFLPKRFMLTVSRSRFAHAGGKVTLESNPEDSNTSRLKWLNSFQRSAI